MNKVFLYGIASARNQYAVVRYAYIDGEKEPITIKGMVREAEWLRFRNPTIEHVYALDDSSSLAFAYKDTVKSNSVEGNVVFKCMLEQNGIIII